MQAQAVSDLPGSLKKIVGAFQMVPDAMARYKQLLFFASKLDPLPVEDQIEENRVHGCVSQVWVKAWLNEGLMHFQADSDSQLIKGLAALLVQGLNGCSPQEILQVEPDFIEMLGLKQSLTPSRNNGFLNMFRMMQRRTLELVSADLKSQEATAQTDGVSSVAGNGNSGSPSQTPVEDAIRQKLTKELDPEELVIVNESDKHAGHAGNPNGGAETHFKLRIISSEFEGMNPVQRHRRVFGILKEELAGPVHACGLDTKTPEEAKTA